MQTLSIPKAKEFISHIAIRKDKPTMVWGQPGVGKSQMMKQLAADMDAHFIDIRLSQYDSVDMRGIPGIVNGFTTWNPPETLPFVGNPVFEKMAHKLIIIFFDEINSAADPVLAVAYQLILDRAVGEHKLMPNVRIVAAGNRDGDKGITRKMPQPLNNRFKHLEVGLDVDAVSVHFQSIGLPSVGVAFLQFRKPLLSTFIINKDGNATVTLDKAYATPRSWQDALEIYDDTTMPHDVKVAGMAGAIGDGPTNEFFGFVEIYSKIKDLVPSILKNPESAKLPDERSLVYAVTVALSGEMKASNVGAIHKYLTRLDAEFTVLAWMLATKRDDSMYSVPEYVQFAKQFKPVFA
jgi:hypothetical protein